MQRKPDAKCTTLDKIFYNVLLTDSFFIFVCLISQNINVAKADLNSNTWTWFSSTSWILELFITFHHQLHHEAVSVCVFSNLHFMYMGVLETCMSVHTWCLWGLEQSVRSPGSGVKDSCELLYRYWNQTPVLWKQSMFLTAESSPQLRSLNCNRFYFIFTTI